ncbi:MAG: SDR family NAD(P)-dependent oxidoreductase [Myxococcota bacterium]
MDFSNDKVLITGGTRGIGRQLARDFAEHGARVVVCGRDRERLTSVAAHPNIDATPCDVRDDASVQALAATVADTLGTPTVVINNAAIFQQIALLDSPVESWLREVDINLMGVLRVTHALLPGLLDADRATIVNLTSPAGYVPMTAAPVYSATKAAINSWSQSLHHQLRHTNVSVIMVNPPVVDTQMNADNPNVEGMKRWSTEAFSEAVLSQFSRSRTRDIHIGDAWLVSRIARFVPSMIFSRMNPS